MKLRDLVEVTKAGSMANKKLAAIHQMGVVAAEAIERDVNEGGDGAAAEELEANRNLHARGQECRRWSSAEQGSPPSRQHRKQ